MNTNKTDFGMLPNVEEQQPTNHRRTWRPSDDAKLTFMFQHGVSFDDIARHLSRTIESVKWRIKVLKLRAAIDDDRSVDDWFGDIGPVLPGENGEMISVRSLENMPRQERPEHAATMNPKQIINPKRVPIEMIERRYLWGLIVTTSWRYADTTKMKFTPNQ